MDVQLSAIQSCWGEAFLLYMRAPCPAISSVWQFLLAMWLLTDTSMPSFQHRNGGVVFELLAVTNEGLDKDIGKTALCSLPSLASLGSMNTTSGVLKCLHNHSELSRPFLVYQLLILTFAHLDLS